MSNRTEKSQTTKQAIKIVATPRVLLSSLTNGSNKKPIEKPYRVNPETAEERERRLQRRKALTLEVFKWAFDNNRNKAG